jgi:hypothetical protein
LLFLLGEAAEAIGESSVLSIELGEIALTKGLNPVDISLIDNGDISFGFLFFITGITEGDFSGDIIVLLLF